VPVTCRIAWRSQSRKPSLIGRKACLLLRCSLLGRFRSGLLTGTVAACCEVIRDKQQQYDPRAEHGGTNITLDQRGAKQNAQSRKQREDELGAEAKVNRYDADD